MSRDLGRNRTCRGEEASATLNAEEAECGLQGFQGPGNLEQQVGQRPSRGTDETQGKGPCLITESPLQWLLGFPRFAYSAGVRREPPGFFLSIGSLASCQHFATGNGGKGSATGEYIRAEQRSRRVFFRVLDSWSSLVSCAKTRRETTRNDEKRPETRGRTGDRRWSVGACTRRSSFAFLIGRYLELQGTMFALISSNLEASRLSCPLCSFPDTRGNNVQSFVQLCRRKKSVFFEKFGKV